MNGTGIVDGIPIIDIAPLVGRTDGMTEVGAKIGRACRELGFFYIVGHGVDEDVQHRLEELSRRFFAQDPAQKMLIAMERGGRAWRGYFPVGGELTSGRPDLKEGLYFGAELGENNALVRAGVPLHGPNLFPPDIPGFRQNVLEYMSAMTALGHRLMSGIALGLGLDESYFHEHYTADPLTLFRIFHYPPSADVDSWGVGEHTDYGLLTILRQDEAGGLEVKSRRGWVEAPPIPGSFICNLGDMLDRMTGGLYRSTPHRVRNRGGRARLSFPFFFDPNFQSEVHPIDLNRQIEDDRGERWDRASVHEFRGTYGDYLLAKVAKVFPYLGREVLPSS